jgi:hypothetical protein
MKGLRENGREEVDRVCWAPGAADGKDYNRNQAIDTYWNNGHSSTKTCLMWVGLSGKRG